MKKLVILLLLFSVGISAQTADELFAKANNFYKDGKYEQAIDVYKRIIDKGEVSSELYYNIGNTYYKLNKVAPTIYNYEKALQLNPTNQDAHNNLVFAKRLTLDRIEALPKSVFQRFNESVLQKFSYNSWAKIAVLFSALGSLLFLLFYFTSISSKKRLFFTASISCFLLFVFSLFVAYHQFSNSKSSVEAIIFAEEVSVQNEPTNNSDEAFVIHEGTKVNILDTVDDWKKVKLIDGKIGWMLAKDLKEI